MAHSRLSVLGALVALACGSRSELMPGRASASAGAAGTAPVPECVLASDCLQPRPGECGVAVCTDGLCSLEVQRVCDDGNPCTRDSCQNDECHFEDDRVDNDRDGSFARGNSADPNAALGCGDDCDDSNPDIFPGALERCDSFDNDCNGIVDDGTALRPSPLPPTRVSPLDAVSANAGGLAFDGEGFGATLSSNLGTWQNQFRRLSPTGAPLAEATRVAHVNAESYAGPIVWTGERFLTAYYDARQDDNYEIYLDVLNRSGQRLFDDRRLTSAAEMSLRPELLWTGTEGLVLWEDRRFEGSGDSSSIFGQRVDLDGESIGGNERLSPSGVYAQDVAAALSDTGVGVAFLSLDAGDRTRLRFMTTSRSLTLPSPPAPLDFQDPDGPVVTAVGDRYVVTFHRFNSVEVGPSIYGAVYHSNGAPELGPVALTSGARHARGNATYSYGDRFVMVWSDDLDGPYQLYAQVFDKKLAPLSERLRLTRTMADAMGPAVAASSDGGLGVLYTDESSGTRQVFFTRLDCAAPRQDKPR